MKIQKVSNIRVEPVLTQPFTILIQWDEVEDVIGYNVYYSESPLSELNKVNETLILGNNIEIVLPSTANRFLYFWVEGVYSNLTTTPLDNYGIYKKSEYAFKNDLGGSMGIKEFVQKKIFNEEPTGNKDGTNTEFTTRYSFKADSVRVYKNGLRLKLSLDYTLDSPNKIIFTNPPLVNDTILVDYETPENID